LIAFTATLGREPQIFVIKPDGSGRRRLTHRSSGAANPSFSSDGRELVFDSHRELFRMNADGSDQERLARVAILPSFSPDGLTIAFQRPGRRGIWTMNADGTDGKRITADGSDFSFSPDSRKIVFADDAGDILVMNADGSHRRRLTSHKKQDAAFAPCFSPDGRKIVFATAIGVIFVMNAKTGAVKDKPLITASGIPTSVDWGRRPRRREGEGP
jgi:Tol biopolymer transport system component